MKIKELGIIIKEAVLSDDKKGYYDEGKTTIVINKNQSKVGKQIVLIHEMLHAIDAQFLAIGLSKKRMSHKLIQNLAPNLLMLFVFSGYWKGVSKVELKKFFKEHPETCIDEKM